MLHGRLKQEFDELASVSRLVRPEVRSDHLQVDDRRTAPGMVQALHAVPGQTDDVGGSAEGRFDEGEQGDGFSEDDAGLLPGHRTELGQERGVDGAAFVLGGMR
ncbi:hypothetical protein [Rhodococcus ruber]|uniref:hypothetical protein n=1 Tax=Rhodococcus ruber TaxID=1830 RepID=UPI001559E45B|nr:hypothetical protein [Rhodococcus ruber]